MPGPEQLIIIDSDIALFDPSSFLPAIPIPPIVMGPMKAKGKAKVHNKMLCLLNDEKSVIVNSAYITVSHPIPGNGKFEITALTPPQITQKTKHNSQSIITKGQQFIAKLTVSSPAKVPTPAGPQPSPVPMHPGKGLFPFPANFNVFSK